MKKLLLLSFLFTMICNLANASHLHGGELKYEYTSANTYRILLDIYSECGGSGINNTEMVIISGPSSFSMALNLVKTGTDTVEPYCPGTITKCTSVSSSFPGYIRTHYAALISLPSSPLGTYTVAFSSSARNLTMNINGGNLYLETTINNTLGSNNCVWIPNVPAIFLTSGTSISLPLHGVDAEGDSIVYTLVQPKTSATTYSAYNIGYTLSSPLGTGSICNFSGKNLNLLGNTLGNYTISFIVSDYRNGTLVGKMQRDFNVIVISSTSGYTIPTPSTSTTLNSLTCPGKTESLTLTFNDPTSTDSVYVSLTPPVISGWSFTTSSTPGIGSGSATITWTTPISATPASIPYFYIKSFVRDNACNYRGIANFAHVVRLTSCTIADAVWPGDANSDKVVNLLDPLAVAVAFGKTGPARAGATTSWLAQACAPWADTFSTGVNMKHADCNGNGSINLADLSAIVTNFGLTHPKSANAQSKVTGIPDLTFDRTGITFHPGKTVLIPIILGDATSVMNNIYGLAANIIIDGISLSSAPTISYTTSWLGNSTNTLTFNKNLSNNNVAWAYARTDQTMISGQGTIATIGFTIPPTTPIGTKVILKFENDIVVDNKGKPVTTPYNVVYDTITVEPTSINQVNETTVTAFVAPNPSTGNANLYLESETIKDVNIRISDITGKTVWQHATKINIGSQNITLPSQYLQTGVYTIQIMNEALDTNLYLKWVKQ